VYCVCVWEREIERLVWQLVCFSIPTVANEYVSIDHWWDGTWWAATDVLAVKHRRLSVYPPEIPNGLLRDKSAICDITKSPVWYDPIYTALCYIVLYVTVLFVMCCVNIVCVCSFILCDFVHVCANIYVAICTVTCKAQPMLWHCLFSTRYTEYQLLYNINCKHLLDWTSSVLDSFVVSILHLVQPLPPF